MVPKIGNIGVKSGMGIATSVASWFTAQPNTNRRITVGIFVFDEVISKMYDNISKIQIDIINEAIFSF
jgi:hypothetical protein